MGKPKNKEAKKSEETNEKPVEKAETTPAEKPTKKDVPLKERFKNMFNERKSAMLNKKCTGEPSMEGVEGDPALQKYFDKYKSL